MFTGASDSPALVTEFVTQDYELSVGLLEILSLQTSNYKHMPILFLILTVIHCSDIVGFHLLFITSALGPIFLPADSGTKVPV